VKGLGWLADAGGEEEEEEEEERNGWAATGRPTWQCWPWTGWIRFRRGVGPSPDGA